jgi:hypothetical protein
VEDGREEEEGFGAVEDGGGGRRLPLRTRIAMRSVEGGGAWWDGEVVEGGPGREDDAEKLKEDVLLLLALEEWSRVGCCSTDESSSEGGRRSQTIHQPRLVLLVRSRSWRTMPEGKVEDAREVAVRVLRTWLWTLRASMRVQEDVRVDLLVVLEPLREDDVRDRPSAAGVPGSGMLGMLV